MFVFENGNDTGAGPARPVFSGSDCFQALFKGFKSLICGIISSLTSGVAVISDTPRE
jgi:hypothetical protein